MKTNTTQCALCLTSAWLAGSASSFFSASASAWLLHQTKEVGRRDRRNWKKKTVTWTKVMPSCVLAAMHNEESKASLELKKKDKPRGRKVPNNPTMTTNTEQLPTLWLFLTKHYGTRPAEAGASNAQGKPADPPESQCNYYAVTWLTCHL